MASISEADSGSVDPGRVDPGSVDTSEAGRQLLQAAHDAQVAYDCLALGDIHRAQVHTITARAAADAAENVLRAALGEDSRQPAGL
jgi:hypothetical protein